MTPDKSKITAIIIVCVCIALSGTVPPTHTTRHAKLTLRNDSLSEAQAISSETHFHSPDSIVITGYDKPLRSMRETFFVTNHFSSTVTSVNLQMVYTAEDSMMLHARNVTIKCDIPPNETRQLYTTAWDRQFTYYHQGTRIKPRSRGAVPYRVELTPIQVTLYRNPTDEEIDNQSDFLIDTP